jgi:uncharacterized protein YicC (UPF0701 family)
LLTLFGLLSAFLAAINQAMRLWETGQEETGAEDGEALSSSLENIEARLDAIEEALEQLAQDRAEILAKDSQSAPEAAHVP